MSNANKGDEDWNRVTVTHFGKCPPCISGMVGELETNISPLQYYTALAATVQLSYLLAGCRAKRYTDLSLCQNGIEFVYILKYEPAALVASDLIYDE